MTSVVTVIQQKGGTGKTSLVAHVGVALSKRGWRVALVDLDPQESLSMWYKIRCANGLPTQNLVLKTSTHWALSGDLRRWGRDFDVVFIDNPPHVENSARQAIRSGDLVIVPCQLSPVDIWATRAILEMIFSENKPSLVVLNRVPPQGKVAEALRQELVASSLPLAQTTLGNRTAYMASFLEGKGVTEFDKNSFAALEIDLLSNELEKKLGLSLPVMEDALEETTP